MKRLFLLGFVLTGCVSAFPPATAQTPAAPPPPLPSPSAATQPIGSAPSTTTNGTTGSSTLFEDTRDLKLYPLHTPHPASLIRVVGSTTINQVVHGWADAYRKTQPAVTFKIVSGGSNVGFAALVSGRADFAALSRPATREELAAFRAKFGHDPTSILVGLDAVAIFVNKDNPLQTLSVANVDAIYSYASVHGARKVDTWGDLGLEGDWAKQIPIRYGPPPGHGDFDLFRSVVLLNGTQRLDIREDLFPSSIAQGVGSDHSAIGYTSIAYETPAIRALALAGDDNVPYAPTRENVLTGKYPLSRPLLLYFNKDPNKPLPDVLADFGLFITSKTGQQIAGNAGMLTLNPEFQAQSIQKLK